MNARDNTMTSMKKMEKFTYRYGIDAGLCFDVWPGLFFTPRGAGRLMNIAGYIMGLRASGKEAQAEVMAKSLDDKLQYLSDYGGMTTTAVDGDQAVSYRSYRVVLGDDGTFGGFTVSWYRAIPNERVQEHASELLGPICQAHPDWSEDDQWRQALAQARDAFRIPSKGTPLHSVAEDWISYVPRWMKEARERGETGLYNKRFWVEYGFSFNGGLLLHGMGHENFAVDLSNDSGPRWSIHT